MNKTNSHPIDHVDPVRHWTLHRVLGAMAFLALMSAIVVAADAKEIDAEQWRLEQMATIAEKLRAADTESERREYRSQQSWLRRWKPGSMTTASDDVDNGSDRSALVDEPALKDLERPAGIETETWRSMVELQSRLIAVDNDDERKANLRRTITLARQLEAMLSSHLASESQSLATKTGWALAHTRYRLGRALAYRELPDVRERWPISDGEQYEQELQGAYQRLVEQTEDERPEFILLADRMLRRAGEKGRALEMLEANRNVIEPRWYLKKRRDLLNELHWDPPYREAARLYREAGHDEILSESRGDTE